MTSIEARELAAWATNIWTVEKSHGRISIPRGSCTFRHETFDYLIRVAPGVEFELNNRGHFNDKDTRGVQAFSASIARYGKNGERGMIYWDYEADQIVPSSRSCPQIWERHSQKERDSYVQFEQQWETPFRRFCWLVGFEVEATFTEKAQWVEGLSSEASERWKLNAIPPTTT